MLFVRLRGALTRAMSYIRDARREKTLARNPIDRLRALACAVRRRGRRQRPSFASRCVDSRVPSANDLGPNMCPRTVL